MRDAGIVRAGAAEKRPAIDDELTAAHCAQIGRSEASGSAAADKDGVEFPLVVRIDIEDRLRTAGPRAPPRSAPTILDCQAVSRASQIAAPSNIAISLIRCRPLRVGRTEPCSLGVRSAVPASRSRDRTTGTAALPGWGSRLRAGSGAARLAAASRADPLSRRLGVEPCTIPLKRWSQSGHCKGVDWHALLPLRRPGGAVCRPDAVIADCWQLRPLASSLAELVADDLGALDQGVELVLGDVALQQDQAAVGGDAEAIGRDVLAAACGSGRPPARPSR